MDRGRFCPEAFSALSLLPLCWDSTSPTLRVVTLDVPSGRDVLMAPPARKMVTKSESRCGIGVAFPATQVTSQTVTRSLSMIGFGPAEAVVGPVCGSSATKKKIRPENVRIGGSPLHHRQLGRSDTSTEPHRWRKSCCDPGPSHPPTTDVLVSGMLLWAPGPIGSQTPSLS
jgi:hypothetical protein